MLKAHWRVISRLERVGDNILIVIAFLLSYTFRDEFFGIARALHLASEQTVLGPIESYYIVLGIALPLYNAILEALGAYRSMRLIGLWELLRLGTASSLFSFLCLGSVFYFLKLDFSRSFVGLFCALSGVGLFLERYIILRVLRYFRARGRNFRNVLIVGTGTQANKISHEIFKLDELGLRVVGFVDTRVPEEGEEQRNGGQSQIYDLPARIVADPTTFEGALKRFAVDEVVFTDVLESYGVIRDMARISVEEGVRVTMAADLFSMEIFKSEMSYLGTVPLLHYHPSAGVAESPAHILKRWIDVLISVVLLVTLAPFLLLVACAVKFSSPGPVFFRQRRVGLNGRTFTLLKFRSMVQNAEEMLPELRSRNEMSGPVFKIREDPRVTPVGRFLRRYSIDELPQLWNVLRGDMSLVGPRPPLPEEVTLYLRKHRKRLSMRPGLTCTWQVSGRNAIPDFERWAELDLEYIDNWSLTTDFVLLLKTIPAVLSGFGAR